MMEVKNTNNLDTEASPSVFDAAASSIRSIQDPATPLALAFNQSTDAVLMAKVSDAERAAYQSTRKTSHAGNNASFIPSHPRKDAHPNFMGSTSNLQPHRIAKKNDYDETDIATNTSCCNFTEDGSPLAPPPTLPPPPNAALIAVLETPTAPSPMSDNRKMLVQQLESVMTSIASISPKPPSAPRRLSTSVRTQTNHSEKSIEILDDSPHKSLDHNTSSQSGGLSPSTLQHHTTPNSTAALPDTNANSIRMENSLIGESHLAQIPILPNAFIEEEDMQVVSATKPEATDKSKDMILEPVLRVASPHVHQHADNPSSPHYHLHSLSPDDLGLVRQSRYHDPCRVLSDDESEVWKYVGGAESKIKNNRMPTGEKPSSPRRDIAPIDTGTPMSAKSFVSGKSDANVKHLQIGLNSPKNKTVPSSVTTRSEGVAAVTSHSASYPSTVACITSSLPPATVESNPGETPAVVFEESDEKSVTKGEDYIHPSPSDLAYTIKESTFNKPFAFGTEPSETDQNWIPRTAQEEDICSGKFEATVQEQMSRDTSPTPTPPLSSRSRSLSIRQGRMLYEQAAKSRGEDLNAPTPTTSRVREVVAQVRKMSGKAITTGLTAATALELEANCSPAKKEVVFKVEEDEDIPARKTRPQNNEFSGIKENEAVPSPQKNLNGSSSSARKYEVFEGNERSFAGSFEEQKDFGKQVESLCNSEATSAANTPKPSSLPMPSMRPANASMLLTFSGGHPGTIERSFRRAPSGNVTPSLHCLPTLSFRNRQGSDMEAFAGTVKPSQLLVKDITDESMIASSGEESYSSSTSLSDTGAVTWVPVAAFFEEQSPTPMPTDTETAQKKHTRPKKPTKKRPSVIEEFIDAVGTEGTRFLNDVADSAVATARETAAAGVAYWGLDGQPHPSRRGSKDSACTPGGLLFGTKSPSRLPVVSPRVVNVPASSHQKIDKSSHSSLPIQLLGGDLDDSPLSHQRNAELNATPGSNNADASTKQSSNSTAASLCLPKLLSVQEIKKEANESTTNKSHIIKPTVSAVSVAQLPTLSPAKERQPTPPHSLLKSKVSRSAYTIDKSNNKAMRGKEVGIPSIGKLLVEFNENTAKFCQLHQTICGQEFPVAFSFGMVQSTVRASSRTCPTVLGNNAPLCLATDYQVREWEGAYKTLVTTRQTIIAKITTALAEARMKDKKLGIEKGESSQLLQLPPALVGPVASVVHRCMMEGDALFAPVAIVPMDEQSATNCLMTTQPQPPNIATANDTTPNPAATRSYYQSRFDESIGSPLEIDGGMDKTTAKALRQLKRRTSSRGTTPQSRVGKRPQSVPQLYSSDDEASVAEVPPPIPFFHLKGQACKLAAAANTIYRNTNAIRTLKVNVDMLTALMTFSVSAKFVGNPLSNQRVSSAGSHNSSHEEFTPTKSITSIVTSMALEHDYLLHCCLNVCPRLLCFLLKIEELRDSISLESMKRFIGLAMDAMRLAGNTSTNATTLCIGDSECRNINIHAATPVASLELFYVLASAAHCIPICVNQATALQPVWQAACEVALSEGLQQVSFGDIVTQTQSEHINGIKRNLYLLSTYLTSSNLTPLRPLSGGSPSHDAPTTKMANAFLNSFQMSAAPKSILRLLAKAPANISFAIKDQTLEIEELQKKLVETVLVSKPLLVDFFGLPTANSPNALPSPTSSVASSDRNAVAIANRPSIFLMACLSKQHGLVRAMLKYVMAVDAKNEKEGQSQRTPSMMLRLLQIAIRIEYNTSALEPHPSKMHILQDPSTTLRTAALTPFQIALVACDAKLADLIAVSGCVSIPIVKRLLIQPVLLNDQLATSTTVSSRINKQSVNNLAPEVEDSNCPPAAFAPPFLSENTGATQLNNSFVLAGRCAEMCKEMITPFQRKSVLGSTKSETPENVVDTSKDLVAENEVFDTIQSLHVQAVRNEQVVKAIGSKA